MDATLLIDFNLLVRKPKDVALLDTLKNGCAMIDVIFPLSQVEIGNGVGNDLFFIAQSRRTNFLTIPLTFKTKIRKNSDFI
jgi:hypothetical protein